ncbi:MAG TPA: thioredoxin domain-containing protein [Vicinamibacterales bacterium]|nr:thioredoxin domain-containing protein [Vicinamibacterales bacterium]
MTEREGNWIRLLEGFAALSIVAVSGLLVWVLLSGHSIVAVAGARTTRTVAPPPAAPLPREPLTVTTLPGEGSPKAKVAVIEFSDFQCPYCGKFAREIQPELEKRYVEPGKVRWLFRHFPLEQIHPFAMKAALAAICADQQGQFWAMHNALFARQAQLDEASVRERARNLKLDAKRFDTCLQNPVTAQVRADTLEGNALSVSGTPTFFIGTVQPDGRVKVVQRLTGARPADQFAKVLDEVLGVDRTAK